MITGVGAGWRGATIVTVTTTAIGAPPRATGPRPPLVRPRSGRLLAGVAAGTAAHLRQDPLVVRVAFAVLATAAGIGVIAYGLLWLTMPVAAPGEDPEPGTVELRARHRPPSAVHPRRCSGSPPRRCSARSCSSSGALVLPLILVAIGLGVVWRQFDTDRTLAVPAARWALAGGIVLAAGGVILLLATTGQLAAARNGFAATLVILTGVVLVTAPVWRRLLDSREEERTARIRSEERASVAAHLHDSVLQTLALIQRHADDQQAVEPAGPRPGARAARLALRPEGGPGGRHLGRHRRRHGGRGRGRPRPDRGPGRRR